MTSCFDPSNVAEVAEALREQIDLLLDRSADRLLNAPAAGTAAWHAAWRARDSANGRTRLQAHRIARIAVAHRLGLDIRPDVRAAHAAGVPAREIEAVVERGRGRRSRRTESENQLILLG